MQIKKKGILQKNIISSNHNCNKGFTIIELMVVMAIIAILVLLFAPKLFNYSKEAKLTHILNDVRAMENVVEVYKMQGNDIEDNFFKVDDISTYINKKQIYNKKGEIDTIDLDKDYYIVTDGFNEIKSQLKGDFITDKDGNVYYIVDSVDSKEVIDDDDDDEDDEYEVEGCDISSLINYTGSDYIYTDNDDGTISIVEYRGFEPNIKIPGKIHGKFVTKIGHGKPYGVFEEKGIKSVELPCVIAEVGSYAFHGNALTELIIPDSVINIDNHAFSTNLIETIELGKNVKIISSNAFSNNRIKSLVIGNTVEIIEDNAFNDNDIENIILSDNIDSPSSLEVIGKAAFKKNKIKNLTIPDSVVEIRDTAFYENIIEKLHIGDGVEFIGEMAFMNSNINDIKMGSSIKTIGTYAFSGNNLTGIDIKSAEIIGASSFYDNKLENLTLPNNLKTIEKSAFVGNKIESLIIPDSVVTIGDSVFKNNAISYLKLGESVKEIGNGVFSYQTKRDYLGRTYNTLNSYIVIPDSVEIIGSEAFSENEITGVTLGSSLRIINDKAFYSSSIGEIIIPDSVTHIGKSAFSNTNKYLKNLVIGNGITTIPYGAFESGGLTEVVIPSNVREIESYAFRSNNLKIITIGSDVVTHENAISKDFHDAYIATGKATGTYKTTVSSQRGPWTKQ